MSTAISEADFQQQVIAAAHLFGWRVAHFRASLRQSGAWSTAVAADGAGFPDLVLVHPSGRLIFAELKSAKGRLSDAQRVWLETLRHTAAEVFVWRPDDFDDVMGVLRGDRN